jgi:glycolate oxidase
MPEPDQSTLARRKDIIAAMRNIVPNDGGVIVDEDRLRPYECDGLMAYRQLPMIVVLPENTGQVAAILKYCHTHKIRVVPRGAGTGLSGGALPMADAITISMMKFNRVLDIDWDNRAVVVQPGVTNLGITRAVEHKGFYYAPDPSSQIACSIEIRTNHQQCPWC